MILIVLDILHNLSQKDLLEFNNVYIFLLLSVEISLGIF